MIVIHFLLSMARGLAVSAFAFLVISGCSKQPSTTTDVKSNQPTPKDTKPITGDAGIEDVFCTEAMINTPCSPPPKKYCGPAGPACKCKTTCP
jgi:hypothetical protein